MTSRLVSWPLLAAIGLSLLLHFLLLVSAGPFWVVVPAEIDFPIEATLESLPAAKPAPPAEKPPARLIPSPAAPEPEPVSCADPPIPNQVWCSDITYIPMQGGFMYLVAIMDWYSRYVLSWRTSNTLDTEFCVAALEDALRHVKPDIFNTDQGSQFTSREFTGRLEQNQVAISMDGRGRAMDNIFIERLWWSVKYEDVYLKEYASVADLNEGLDRYFDFYDHRRKHQSLDYRTPYDVFNSGRSSARPRDSSKGNRPALS